MSYYDFVVARRLHTEDASFAALIMAAMWKADSINSAMLRAQWPELWDEITARYHAPAGLLPEERKGDELAEKADEG